MQSLTVEVSEELAAKMTVFLDHHPEYPDRHALVREALCRQTNAR